jgi:hypothetical protein
MLWLLGKQAGPPGSDSRRPLVLAACACARLALRYVPKGEERPKRAIKTAEAWAEGKDGVTIKDVRKTAYAAAYAANATANAAANAAAYAAYADAAAYAANAAAYATNTAANAAAGAAYAAAGAAYAAYATNTAAYADAAAGAAYAAYVAARTRTLAKCADIVRHFYPRAPKSGGKP